MPRKHTPSLSEKMHAKDWRALPQIVALRGDTRPAKRRRKRDVLRVFSVAVLVCGIVSLLVYVWLDLMADMSEGTAKRPGGLDFVNESGFLREDWFRKWTGFDETRAPNLNALRDRLLAYPQVLDARILRLNDGKIRVILQERSPVARWFDASGGAWLIAYDGVVFPAETFPRTQNALPELLDVKISSDGDGFRRLPGIAPLAEFIDLARTRYPGLFAKWDTISLADFPSDPQDIPLPWSVLRVIPRPTAQNPGHARIEEIVFSASRFREDLKLLAAADSDGALDRELGADRPGRPKAYRICFITNRKNPGKEFREMRLVPSAAGTP